MLDLIHSQATDNINHQVANVMSKSVSQSFQGMSLHASLSSSTLISPLMSHTNWIVDMGATYILFIQLIISHPSQNL